MGLIWGDGIVLKQKKVNQESGQGMVEYGLIIGLVALLVIGVFIILGEGITGQSGVITDAMGDEAQGQRGAALSAVLY